MMRLSLCFRSPKLMLSTGLPVSSATASEKIFFTMLSEELGSEQYNLDLSQRRARFVVGALKQAGISEQLLKYFAFGESDPAVPTEDGVAEPRNRRVEIFIE
jgi:hypothetical protein